MNKFPWIKPIILHSPDEGHRQASWLELFIDLGFVVAIGSISRIFDDGFSVDNLLAYLGVFFAIFGFGIGLLGMLHTMIMMIFHSD